MKFLVVYNTDLFRGLQIVIHADDKANVRGILKKHLCGKPFTISRITEVSVNEKD